MADAGTHLGLWFFWGFFKWEWGALVAERADGAAEGNDWKEWIYEAAPVLWGVKW